MKINLFKSRPKRTAGYHYSFSSSTYPACKEPDEDAITCSTHNRDVEASNNQLFVNIHSHSSPEVSPSANVLPPDIKIVGCHIEGDTNGFEQHETDAIVQQIRKTYLMDVDAIIRHRLSYDTTIVVDLHIDNFSRIARVDVLHPHLLPGDEFPDDITSQTKDWVFPSILHRGRCRVAFSEKI